MNDKLNLNGLANTDSSFYVHIVFGSSPRDSPIVSCALAKKDGIDFRRTAAHFFFDWEKELRCRVDGELDSKILDAFGPEDFVEAIPPLDQEALKKAEEAGDLYPAGDGMVPESWCHCRAQGCHWHAALRPAPGLGQ